jgi:plasmid stability protein
MTTTLNLPDDLASAVQQRAAQRGHDVAAEVVELLRKGLDLTEPIPDAAPVPATITTDPVTGLPLIIGAPNAPISRMTTGQIQALIDQAQEQEDLERLGIPLRR